MDKELLFTFVDTFSWDIYLWFNKRTNTINTLNLQLNTVEHPEKTFKKRIIDFINELNFLPEVKYEELCHGLIASGSFTYEESKIDHSVYLIYLNKLDPEIKRCLEYFIEAYNNLSINRDRYYCIKHSLMEFSQLERLNPYRHWKQINREKGKKIKKHRALQSWFSEDRLICDLASRLIIMKPYKQNLQLSELLIEQPSSFIYKETRL